MFVTGDCVDPRYNDPYVDIDEQRTTPVPHRYVHGGFKGTDAKFSFCFPPREQYQGRFFQNTHQLLTSENGPPGNIAFAIASGAYYVQTNIGGKERATTTEQAVFGKLDPTAGGYRVNAEAAKFSRVKAAEIYGKINRPWGYLYGGSGGAFQTVSSAENTVGVWDGFVPYVMGSPNSIPGGFTVRIHALRVLKDKFPGIMDAIDPGGSGNPYAGLNEEERGALEEATRMGIPLRGWWNYATLTGGPLALVAGYVPYLDPTYTNDFWTKPGYLGTDPKSSVSKARIQHEATVVNVINGPQKRLELSSVPTGDLTGADLIVTSGAAAGKSVGLSPVVNNNTVAFGLGANPAVVNSIQAGDKVRIDNSAFLALQTFHRHNIPSRDLYGWNEFRNSKGEPIYPQRSVLIGPIGSMNGAGSIQNGRFKGKMIVLESLMDIDALPWQADWYRTKVKEALGKRLDDEFRLYFTDHAQHTPPAGLAAEARTVSYQGALEQAIRDVSAWVEKGVKPPPSTAYKIVDTQVEIPLKAEARKGIQPVVELKVNGGVRAAVAVGQPVALTATVEVPPNTGKVVAVEWNFDGDGRYVPAELAGISPAVSVNATHAWSQPGTYFPVLRAFSQREGDPKTQFARIQNLGRARVVVK